MTGKGSLTVYPMAMPVGYNMISQPYQQQTLAAPPVYPPRLTRAQQTTATWRKLACVGCFVAVMVIAGVLIPRFVIGSNSRSSNSRSSRTPTPSATKVVVGGTPTATPTPTSAAYTGTVSTFQVISSGAPVRTVSASKSGSVYVGAYASIYQFVEGQAKVSSPNSYAGFTSGYLDGSLAGSQFTTGFGLAVDSAGTVLIADSDNAVIRSITSGSSNVVTVLGAGGIRVLVDGSETNARFENPTQLAIDGNNNQALFAKITGIAFSPSGDELYVADSGNHCIRRVFLATGQVTTLAGLCRYSGNIDGRGSNARFTNPNSIAVGPTGTIYVGDNTNYVRQIN